MLEHRMVLILEREWSNTVLRVPIPKHINDTLEMVDLESEDFQDRLNDAMDELIEWQDENFSGDGFEGKGLGYEKV